MENYEYFEVITIDEQKVFKENDVCRLCVKNTCDYSSIFQEDLHELLNLRFGTLILKTDNWPKSICSQCLNTAKMCLNFITTVRNNEAKLVESYGKWKHVEQEEEKIQIHEKVSGNLSEYEEEENVCNRCGKKFARKDSLQRHISTVHEYKIYFGDGFRCPTCPKVYRGEYNLYKHMKGSHPTFKFTKKYIFSKPHYACTQCDLKFKDPVDLHIHIAVNHDGKFLGEADAHGTYTCFHCEKSYASKLIFRAHLLTIHKYARKYAVKSIMHIKKKPRGEPKKKNLASPRPKPRYEKMIKNENIFKEHIKFGALDQQMRFFKCNFCGKVFKSKSYFIKHIEDHKMKSQQLPEIEPVQEHVTDYPCYRCGKYMANKHTLKAHIENIHEFTEEKFYKCTYCSKVQKTKQHHLTHMAKHRAQERLSKEPHEELPLCCLYCKNKKIFSTKYTLERHILNKHKANDHGENPERHTKKQIKCPLCPHTSPNSSTHKTHIIKAHSMKYTNQQENVSEEVLPEENQESTPSIKEEFNELVAGTSQADSTIITFEVNMLN